jgi:hypothetical protein
MSEPSMCKNQEGKKKIMKQYGTDFDMYIRDEIWWLLAFLQETVCFCGIIIFLRKLIFFLF